MAGKEPVGRPNAVMLAVAAIVAAGAIFNAVSALFAGMVWVPSLSELTLYRVEKSEPLIFYGILGGFTALAAYFCWDVWRTHRNWQRADKG
jgi:hypothetical protein